MPKLTVATVASAIQEGHLLEGQLAVREPPRGGAGDISEALVLKMVVRSVVPHGLAVVDEKAHPPATEASIVGGLLLMITRRAWCAGSDV
jgi:hypothetical protein